MFRVITTSGGGLNAFAAAVITELIRNGKAYEHVELVRNDAAVRKNSYVHLFNVVINLEEDANYPGDIRETPTFEM